MSSDTPSTAPPAVQPEPEPEPSTNLGVLFVRGASTADRVRALQDFGATVRVRLRDATSAAGQSADDLAERGGQLLSETVRQLPIRRAHDLRHEFGPDAQIRAARVIDDATTIARWLWVAVKAVPIPETAIHAAKVIIHSAIEIRMVGELLEAHRDVETDETVVPLPTILLIWATGQVGTSTLSASSVAPILVKQVRRALKDLRGDDGRLRSLMSRGREGGDIVRRLGESLNGALSQPSGR